MKQSSQSKWIQKKGQKHSKCEALILGVQNLSYQNKLLFLTGYASSELNIQPNPKNNNQIIKIINGAYEATTNDIISKTNFIQVLVQCFYNESSLIGNRSNEEILKRLQDRLNYYVGELACNRMFLREKWIKQKQTQSYVKKEKQVFEQKSETYDEETQNLIRLLQQEEKKQMQQRHRRQKQAQIKLKQFLKQQQKKEDEMKKLRLQTEDKNLTCQICLQQIPYTDVGSLNCNHIFHRGCIRNHIQALINQKKIDIACPLACGKFMTIDDVHEYIDGELKQKYDKFCFDIYVQRNDKSTSWCPTAGCTAVFSHEGGLDNYRCPICKKHYCLNCRCEYHRGMTCAEYRISHNYSEDDKKFQEFVVGAKFKQCPKCKFWVERTAGCSTMTCRCGHQFCYQCGGSDCPHGSCKNKPGGILGAVLPLINR